MSTTTDAEWYCLWTLVETAQADGVVSPLEVMFINNVMKNLHVDPEERARVKRMLRGEESLPELSTLKRVADYDTRLGIFTDAVELACADGEFNDLERTHIRKLVQRLELHPGDMQRAWDRAIRRL